MEAGPSLKSAFSPLAYARSTPPHPLPSSADAALASRAAVKEEPEPAELSSAAAIPLGVMGSQGLSSVARRREAPISTHYIRCVKCEKRRAVPM